MNTQQQAESYRYFLGSGQAMKWFVQANLDRWHNGEQTQHQLNHFVQCTMEVAYQEYLQWMNANDYVEPMLDDELYIPATSYPEYKARILATRQGGNVAPTPPSPRPTKPKFRFFTKTNEFAAVQCKITPNGGEYDHHIRYMHNQRDYRDFDNCHNHSCMGLGWFVNSEQWTEVTKAEFYTYIRNGQRSMDRSCLLPRRGTKLESVRKVDITFKQPPVIIADTSGGTPLPYTLGVELTAIHKDYRFDWAHCVRANKAINSGKLHEYLSDCGYPTTTYPGNTYVHQDNHCIEISSPVFTSVEQLIEFRRTCFRWFDLNGFRPHNPTVVCGGGHLHFGNVPYHTRKNVLLELINRPYIAWVFLQPDDTQSANNWGLDTGLNDGIKSFHDGEVTRDSLKWRFGSTKYHVFAMTQHCEERESDVFVASKDHCVCVDDNHQGKIEYRCVEAPRNEQEQLDQFMFFYRFTRWCDTEYQRKGYTTATFRSYQEWQSFSPAPFISEFRALLRKLDLPWGRYKKYVTRNLLPRWEEGRERM